MPQHDIFISYRDSANDRAAAEAVCAHLEAEGFSCWIAPRDVLEGDDYGAAIVRAIQDCRVLVLVFSAAANASRQIVRELKLADDAEKTVLPIRIEKVSPSDNFAYFLGAAQFLDAFGGVREEHLKKLALGLRKRLGPAGEIRVTPVETAPVVDVSTPTSPKSAVPPAGAETESHEQVRAGVEVRRYPAIRQISWTGVKARYAYVAVALATISVIAWKQGGAPLNTPKGGPLLNTTKGEPTKGTPAATLAAPGMATRVNPADGLTYVFIPRGAFMMGCSPGDAVCDSNEKPPHTEQIADGFWLGQTEVTQAAWTKVKGANPSKFRGDQLPVESVDWDQASAYCKAIGGRLPTEKQWEYAARARTAGERYDALDAVAWYSSNSGSTSHPVGLKQPNAFGLHDMLGNVWEWTSDNYDAHRKVARGGSWGNVPRVVRVSFRYVGEPTDQGSGIGFRCALGFR